MKLTELIAKLKACNSGDCEADHCEADDLLLEFIGIAEVKEAFDAIEKWYA